LQQFLFTKKQRGPKRRLSAFLLAFLVESIFTLGAGDRDDSPAAGNPQTAFTVGTFEIFMLSVRNSLKKRRNRRKFRFQFVFQSQKRGIFLTAIEMIA
jgi:hypothetical protein